MCFIKEIYSKMHALTWSTLFIIIHFSYYFVLCEINNNGEDEGNPASNQKIEEIAKNIDKIASAPYTHSSASNRGHDLNNLENKLSGKGSTGIKHAQLLMEGVKLKLLNEIKEDNKQISIEENAAKEVDVNENNDQKEVASESLIDYKLSHFPTSENQENKIDPVSVKQNEILTNDSRRMIEHEVDFKNPHDGRTDIVDEGTFKSEQNVKNINNFKTSNERTICHDFINRTCEDIKNMNRLKCRYEQSYITLDKLCDGNPDCPFGSDEKNCYSQVMEQYLYLKQVEVNNIETSRYSRCFGFDVSRFVLTNQAKTLRNMVENELNFKMKYLNNSFHKTNKNYKKDQKNEELEARQEKMSNNIALVISSVALALDGAFCSHKLDRFDTRRSNDLFDMDLDKEFKETLSPSEGCKCENEFCFNCTHYCKRLCRQKYSLTNWNCVSLNGTSTVSLNLLCDGKIDCFDKSDEKECDKGTGSTKFKANEMYSTILNMLHLEGSKQRQPIYKKFLLLSDSIIKLQELTTKTVPKLITIKKLRDNCYSMLRNIYSNIVTLSDIGKESEEEYLFLLSINHKLGTALKYSHTGNAKVMGNGCDCKNGTCTLPDCSKNCVKACAVLPKLSKYYCYGKPDFVSLEKICDGVEDCSNGYDELNCKKDEICRRHHLLVLRHNLQRVGENLKGTSLGELLSSWKLKVFSTLKVLEKTERPTPQVIKNFAEDILKDLAVSYGSGDKYRRSTADYVLAVFINISQIILELFKSCRK